MEYPFPYLGAGPGISKHRWSAYVVFEAAQSPDAQAEIAASVPSIIGKEVRWEGELLACRSADDVEYDIRLAAMERARSPAAVASFVEEAYDKANDSARVPKLKAWIPVCRAIDRWVAELHSSRRVRFALKTIEKPASSWHQAGMEKLDEVVTWLSTVLAAADGNWTGGQVFPATARLASEVLSLLPGSSLKDAATRDRALALARSTFDASHEVATEASAFIGHALAAAPPRTRSVVLMAEVARAHPSILLAALERRLRPAIEDAAVTEPLLRAISLAGARRAWLASTFIDGTHRKLPPPPRPWAGDVVEALVPFQSQPFLNAWALHLIPVAHAWSGRADKARASLPAALAVEPVFSARDDALRLCESLLATAEGPASEALAEVRNRFRGG